MADKENCEPISSMSDLTNNINNLSRPDNNLPANLKRNRVVLDDITITDSISSLSALITGDDPDFSDTHKPKLKKKTITEESRADDDIDTVVVKVKPPLIYQYLRKLEAEENRGINPNYMEKIQKDITPNMREILIHWLFEVAEELKFISDTLYLTINFIDRFLSSRVLNRDKLQLLGVSSMLAASKYGEIVISDIENFVLMTDNTYTKQEVIEMESNLVKFLKNQTMGNHYYHPPTARSFIRIFMDPAGVAEDDAIAKVISGNDGFEFLACYIAELSLLDYDICVRFLPSMIAASAIFLARLTIIPCFNCRRPWTLALKQFTGYDSSQLKECVFAMHNLHLQSGGGDGDGDGHEERSRRGGAIRMKYMERKFESVAALIPPSRIPDHFFMS